MLSLALRDFVLILVDADRAMSAHSWVETVLFSKLRPGLDQILEFNNIQARFLRIAILSLLSESLE
jgi:hypothetical protein